MGNKLLFPFLFFWPLWHLSKSVLGPMISGLDLSSRSLDLLHLLPGYTLWMDSLKAEGPIDIILLHPEYKRRWKKEVTRCVPLMERYICITSLGKRKHCNGALSPAERRQEWNHQKYSPCGRKSACSHFYGGRCVYILYLNIISGPLHSFNSPFSFQYTTYNYLLFHLELF